MKEPKSNPFIGAFGAAVCCLSGMTAHAAIIEKADNETALNPTGSWSGGTVPGASSAALAGGLMSLVLMERRRQLAHEAALASPVAENSARITLSDNP